MKQLAITLFFFLIILNLSISQNHPVRTKDGFFYLNGKKFFVKGIGLEITKPGQKVDCYASHDPARFRYEIERVLAADYNTIRLWGVQTKEQLEAVKDLDIKIIMGIWIEPHADFSVPGFIENSLKVVKEFLSYSKDYDNIIAYVIMNEPNTDEVMKDFSSTQRLWKTIVDEIHTQHPGTLVGMSAFPNISFVNMDMFDFTGYNVHPGTNPMQEFSFDYAGYINYLKKSHGNKPLIDTEYGVSVATGVDNSRFKGNTQEERQTNGLLAMYRGLIDGGAGGGCTFISADGWYKDGNEFERNTTYHEEGYGLIEYKSVNDMIGTPRPAWYAVKKYNSAVVTSPKNGEVYQNKIPIEIFGSKTIDHFKISSNGYVLLSEKINDNYFNDTLELNLTGIYDKRFEFVFFDQNNVIIKEESIVFLVSNEQDVLPKLAVTARQSKLRGPNSVDVSYRFTNKLGFGNSGSICYSSDPIVEYDNLNSTFKEQVAANGNLSFNKTYGTHFDTSSDILSWMNRDVVIFSAGIDVTFGQFKKRISAYTTVWQDTTYNSVKMRLAADQYKSMLGFLPCVVPNQEAWYVKSIAPKNWIKYQINIEADGKYSLSLNYTSPKEVNLKITDGLVTHNVLLPATQNETSWVTKELNLNLSQGNHKLYFSSDVIGFCIRDLGVRVITPIVKVTNEEVKVYPNPISDNIILIKLPENSPIDEMYRLEIMDLNGRICFSKDYMSDLTHLIKVDLTTNNSNLKGLCLMRLTTNKSVITRNIIIE